MRLIREDKWSEELWEISEDAKTKAQSSARFYFFFGKNDHWVADHYREEFIKKRSQKISNTRVVVDEGKIPHAFCIGSYSSSRPFSTLPFLPNHLCLPRVSAMKSK